MPIAGSPAIDNRIVPWFVRKSQSAFASIGHPR
jgi:hypothetical protein